MEEDLSWHYCATSSPQGGVCEYKTKNRNKMRVHLRTIHAVYYCEYCRERFQMIQKYKQHKQTYPSGQCRYVGGVL